MTTKPTYDIVLGPHKHVADIRSGALKSDAFDLIFHDDYSPTHKAFLPMVRQQAFDICEMAIVTYMLAKAWDKPLVLLPAVMIGRFQQPYASVRADLAMDGPGDLVGKRIGVRSFTTTTVTWLRGMLKNDYGGDLDAAKWISFEDAHVAEYQDPTERAPHGAKIVDMLLNGDLDITLGDVSDDPRARPLFPDAAQAAADWHAKHGLVPINHIVVVSEELVRDHLDHVVALYRMLEQNKAAVPHTGPGPEPTPIGFDALRPSTELILQYVEELGMLPRKLTMDDLFDPRIVEALSQ